MESTVWELILSHGRLSPTQTERAVAPEKVLKRVSCGCRLACSKVGDVIDIERLQGYTKKSESSCRLSGLASMIHNIYL